MNNEESQTESTEENEVETEETEDQTQESTEEEDQQELDGDKAVEKLKKRLGKETAEKHDLAQQLSDAQTLINDLKSGKKSVKELANADKQSKEDNAKDKRIEALESQIAKSNAINETDAVFKEQGLTISQDVLDMVVGDGTDSDAIYKNVKGITDLINATRESARKGWLKDRTPRESGKKTEHKVTTEEFDQMTMAERVKLHATDPEQFNKLTGGI